MRCVQMVSHVCGALGSWLTQCLYLAFLVFLDQTIRVLSLRHLDHPPCIHLIGWNHYEYQSIGSASASSFFIRRRARRVELLWPESAAGESIIPWSRLYASRSVSFNPPQTPCVSFCSAYSKHWLMSLQDLQIATAFFTLILVCLVFVSGNHQRVGEPLQASCGAVSSNVAPPPCSCFYDTTKGMCQSTNWDYFCAFLSACASRSSYNPRLILRNMSGRDSITLSAVEWETPPIFAICAGVTCSNMWSST